MASRQGPPKPAPKPKFDTNDDDWDTDLTYEVDRLLEFLFKKK